MSGAGQGAESKAGMPVMIGAGVEGAKALADRANYLRFGLSTYFRNTHLKEYHSPIHKSSGLPHGGKIDLKFTVDPIYPDTVVGVEFDVQPNYPTAGTGPVTVEPLLGGMAHPLASNQEKVGHVDPIHFSWKTGDTVRRTEVPETMEIKIGSKLLKLQRFSMKPWVIVEAHEVFQGEDQEMVGTINGIVTQLTALPGLN